MSIHTWTSVKEILKRHGFIVGSRADAWSTPSDVSEIIPILRKENISEEQIFVCLTEIDSSIFEYNPESFKSEHFRSAIGGYRMRGGEGDAWIIIGGKCYSSNPLSSTIYNFLHRTYAEHAKSGIGFISEGVLKTGSLKTILRESSISVKEQEVAADKLIDRMFNDAYRDDASDVHFGNSSTGHMEIKFRIDGNLVPYKSFANIDREAVVTRLWERVINGGPLKTFDIQDGRFDYTVDGETFNVRVNKTPAMGYDAITCRILKKKKHLHSLPDFGLEPQDLELFRYYFKQTSGQILITGPTGAGKTSLIHACLRYHRDLYPERHIVSAEDPVEVTLDGVEQIPINHAEGSSMTWGAVTQAFLRMCPDTIFIGEIRDPEICKRAIDMAVTGHLVISTLHVDKAHNVYERLIDLGGNASQISQRHLLYSSQRLLPALCPHCKIESSITKYGNVDRKLYEGLLSEIKNGDLTVFKAHPDGCSNCHRGYKGRIMILEVLERSPELEEVIHAASIGGKSMSMAQFRRRQVANGAFKNLAYKAMLHVGRGNIDLAQMTKVPSIIEDYPQLANALRSVA